MQPKISRRSLLKTGGALLAFAPALKFVAFDRVFDVHADVHAPAGPAKGQALEKYRSGKVGFVNEGGFTSQPDPLSGQALKVVFDSRTKVWKRSWTQPLATEQGDEFVAWGRPNPDGSYTPEQIYFNIFNVYGDVGSPARDATGGAVFDLSGGRQRVHIAADNATLVDIGETEIAFDAEKLPFAVGDLIQVVGVRTAGGLIATRILL